MDLVSYIMGRIVFPETTRQILNSYANKEVYKVKLLKPNHKREQRYQVIHTENIITIMLI